MNYEEWERSVPREITSDSLWKMEAYSADAPCASNVSPIRPNWINQDQPSTGRNWTPCCKTSLSPNHVLRFTFHVQASR